MKNKKQSLEKDKETHLLQKEIRELKAKQKVLINENLSLKKQVDETFSIKTIKTFNILKVKDTKSSEATPIILASDWHYEEKVDPITVNYLNRYDLSVAHKRVDQFFQNTVKLIDKERSSVKMERVILALLGDFISGNIHEPLLPICQLKPIEAIMQVQDEIASGIQFLLKNTKLNFIIPCTMGNHSRITPKVWVASEKGYSLEYLMFHNLRNYFRNESRIQFRIAHGQHEYLEVYGKRLRFYHGTSIKYNQGLGGFTVPANRKIMRWNKMIPTYYDFFGHLHQMFHAPNLFIANGSLIGYNSFALDIGADFQKPYQAFCLLDKKRGITGVFPITFDV